MKTLSKLLGGFTLSILAFMPSTRAAVVTAGTDAELRAAMAACGTVAFDFDGVIVLTNPIVVSCAVTVDATGHAVTLSGGNSRRLFEVQAGGSLTLVNLTVANGRGTNGGAIYNEGTLVAQGCRFTNNLAIGANGADGTNGLPGTNGVNSQTTTPGTLGGAASSGQGASGGAIYSSGEVNLTGCSFASNQAAGGSGGQGGLGGDGGYIPPCCSNFGKNGGDGGGGGAGGSALGGDIASVGVLLVNACTFSNSLVTGGEGGRAGAGGRARGTGASSGQGGRAGLGALAQGGAIFSVGSSIISNSFFAGNVARGGTGGRGASYVEPGGYSGGSTNGGVASGGAIYAANGMITHSTLRENNATGGTGGLGPQNARPGTGGSAWGGAIGADSNSIIANCTLAANAATGGSGGAIGVLLFSGGDGGDAFGGGLAVVQNCSAINLTMNGNGAFPGAAPTNNIPPIPNGTNGHGYGGSIASTGGVFQIVNSILSGGTSNNAWGAVTDLGHNLSSDATPVWTSGTSLNNTDPLLLPLGDNGGPTLTMALRAGSPALNTADCASAPATDQRGVARPDGPGCDIGAYEGAGAPTLSIWRESAATNVVRHLAEAGRAYRLEKTSSSFNGWTPVVTNTAPAGGVLDFRLPASGAPCFYRVVAQ